MTSKPTRTWTARALWQSPGPVALFVHDEPLTALVGSTTTPVSPVEYQLIAVAGCFALSLEAARKAREWPESIFDVTVLGSKAPDLPSRLDRVAIDISIEGPLDAAAQATLLKDAKRLCTVTNTLANAPVLDVELATNRETACRRVRSP
jgi:uncharacterized OsmC-like protein